jgi:hypothetical protein
MSNGLAQNKRLTSPFKIFSVERVNYKNISNTIASSLTYFNPYHAKYLKWTCPSFNTDKTICHFEGEFQNMDCLNTCSADHGQKAMPCQLILVCTGFMGRIC